MYIVGHAGSHGHGPAYVKPLKNMKNIEHACFGGCFLSRMPYSRRKSLESRLEPDLGRESTIFGFEICVLKVSSPSSRFRPSRRFRPPIFAKIIENRQNSDNSPGIAYYPLGIAYCGALCKVVAGGSGVTPVPKP